jgi:hypothetical protein
MTVQESWDLTPFVLPLGWKGDRATVYRHGLIRPATGWDGLAWANHPQVQENPAYGGIILLSRAIAQLDDLTAISPAIVEQLWLRDFHYLQDIYNAINSPAMQISRSGESQATP